MTSDSKDTLREYTRSRSEEAFRNLVREHSPLVYGTALRKLGGNRAAAQDVTQEVFTLLARKASGLGSVVLGGWLYRQACRYSANHVRSESRRRKRESIAMQLQPDSSPSPAAALSGELDDALLALPEADRNALILRFFEGHEFRSLGSELGLSEEAARKRVTRALERLAGNLRRKGIAVGSASLGTVMQGLGAVPVPAGMISAVSDAAFQASAAGSGTGFLTFIKPLAAGAIATSLVAGSALALRDSTAGDLAQGAPPPPPAVSRQERIPRYAEKLPENPSLEQILAEIKRVKSGPGNVVTAQRLNVVLSKIRTGQVPEFILLANGQLTRPERQEIYQPLLTQWWDQDPEAAMTFILKERIDSAMNSADSHYLVGELFRRWVEKDRGASEVWLFRNWEDGLLGKPLGQGTLRNFLSMWITGDLFSHGDVKGVFEFSSRMPATDDAARALANIAGMAPLHTMWTYDEGSKAQWVEFYRGLEQFPDEAWRKELTRHFWKNIGEKHPDTAVEIQKSFSPADPFAASLGLLSVRQLQGKPERTLSGGTSFKPHPVDDRAEREAACVDAGLAQGLTRSQVMSAMGKVLCDGMKTDEYFAWVDRNRGDLELDDFFAAKAREKGGDDKFSAGGPQAEGIQWASRISDPELRRKLCCAALRRMFIHGPDFAKTYLETGAVPEDLAAEFQQIATGQP